MSQVPPSSQQPCETGNITGQVYKAGGWVGGPGFREDGGLVQSPEDVFLNPDSSVSDPGFAFEKGALSMYF